MYWFALIQIVAGQLIYQLSQKAAPKDFNPFGFVAFSYALGTILCLILAVLMPKFSMEQPIDKSPLAFWGIDRHFLACALGLAVGASLIEIGFLLGYRSGWGLSELPIFVTIGTSIFLLLIGVLWFGESMSPSRLVGFGFSAVGIYLVLKK